MEGGEGRAAVLGTASRILGLTEPGVQAGLEPSTFFLSRILGQRGPGHREPVPWASVHSEMPVEMVPPAQPARFCLHFTALGTSHTIYYIFIILKKIFPAKHSNTESRTSPPLPF